MSPILIAGAGPVGLTMAAELARYGVPVRIIDRSPRPAETSRAIVVWSRTLELLDRMGCANAFLEIGHRVHAASIRSGDAVLGRTEFGDIASAYNFALMVPQSDTERLLAAHLRSFGITVEREVELVSFAASTEGVTARLAHAGGREETLETPWLLGCDGAHSAVRHGLGAGSRAPRSETTGSWRIYAWRGRQGRPPTRSRPTCTGTGRSRSFRYEVDAPA